MPAIHPSCALLYFVDQAGANEIDTSDPSAKSAQTEAAPSPDKQTLKLQKHELLELRRVSSYVYKKNKRFAESVELSKQDKLYDDVSKTAAESRDTSRATSTPRSCGVPCGSRQ